VRRGLEDAALAGEQTEVGVAEPTGQRADLLGDRLGAAERREVGQQQCLATLDRTGQGLAVEQREVLEEVQPAGLVHGLVGEPLTEQQVGSRGRASGVDVEAQDAVDLGLPDGVHQENDGSAGSARAWRNDKDGG